MDKFLLLPLGDALGTQLDWDDDGQCCLEFEDGIEITLSLHEALVSLRSFLGEGNASNLRGALASQYRNPRPGFFMALDEASNQLFLMTMLDHEYAELIPETVYQLLTISQELKSSNIFSAFVSRVDDENNAHPVSPNVILA